MRDIVKDDISPLAWSICTQFLRERMEETERLWPYENTSQERCIEACQVDSALSEIKYFIEAAAPLLAKAPPLAATEYDEPRQWSKWIADLLIELTPANEHEGGWVYLIKCNEYTKIGLSSDVEARLKSLQTASPYALTLVTKIAASRPAEIESFLHGYFAAKRCVGEWFALTEDDIARVKFWSASHIADMARRERFCGNPDHTPFPDPPATPATPAEIVSTEVQ